MLLWSACESFCTDLSAMLLFPLGWARGVDYVGVGKNSQITSIHKGKATQKPQMQTIWDTVQMLVSYTKYHIKRNFSKSHVGLIDVV